MQLRIELKNLGFEVETIGYRSHFVIQKMFKLGKVFNLCNLNFMMYEMSIMIANSLL